MDTTSQTNSGQEPPTRGPGLNNRVDHRTQTKHGVTYASADLFTCVYRDGKREPFNLGRNPERAEELGRAVHAKHRAGATSAEIRTWLNLELGRTPQKDDEGGYASIGDVLGFDLGDRKVGIDPQTFRAHQSRAWKVVRTVLASEKHNQQGIAYSATECPAAASQSTALLTGDFAQHYKEICTHAEGEGTRESRHQQACNDLRCFAALLKKKHLRMYTEALARKGVVLPKFDDFRRVALAVKQPKKHVVAPSDVDLRNGQVAVDRLLSHGVSVWLAGRLAREAGLYSLEIDQAHGSWLVMTPSGPQLRVPGKRPRHIPISRSLYAALAARGNDFLLSGATVGARRKHRRKASRFLRMYGIPLRNTLQECREHFAWFISATRKPAVAMRAMGYRVYAAAQPYLEPAQKLTPAMIVLWP